MDHRLRRPLLAAIGVALALAGSLVATPPAPATPAGAPSIVLIITDDQRWDTLWAMPNVTRRLADRGVTFKNGFTVSPLCCPSRASILTGQYPHSTGVWSNAPPYGGMSSFKDGSTIATWLQAVGYRTALVGKYLNGYPYPSRYVPPGWDRWVVFSGRTRYYDYFLNDDGVITYHEDGVRDYSTDVLATAAESFIRETDPSQPLFLYFAPFAPHDPFLPAHRDRHAFRDLPLWRPPSYDEADVTDKPVYIQLVRPFTARSEAEIDLIRRRQLRTLLAVDEAVGGILDALTDMGRMSNTMVVFISDNGYLWGEHRWDVKSVPYDEAIRIPYVVRYDPLTAAPWVDRHLVLTIDLAPTFAELAGVAAPGVEGETLLPLLAGGKVPWRTDFAVELHQGSGAEGWGPASFCEVRSRHLSYVAYATGEEELYDVALDPYQLENRVSDPLYGAVLEAMRTRARELCNPPPPGFTFPGS